MLPLTGARTEVPTVESPDRHQPLQAAITIIVGGRGLLTSAKMAQPDNPNGLRDLLSSSFNAVGHQLKYMHCGITPLLGSLGHIRQARAALCAVLNCHARIVYALDSGNCNRTRDVEHLPARMDDFV